MPDDLRGVLSEGARELGIDLHQAQIDRLLDYVNLLIKWNRVYNLTAVRDRQRILERHILDSLSVLPYLQGTRVIDIGAGAGLPGIPLAIAKPGNAFVLLDSNSKKTRFMQQVKTELSLTNVEVVCSRVEEYQPEPLFDVVISRAFSSLLQMAQWSAHLCAEQGSMLAMKGSYPDAEIAQLLAAPSSDVTKSFEIKAVHNLCTPRSAEKRYLIEFKAAKS